MLNLQLGVRYSITNTTAMAAQLAAGGALPMTPAPSFAERRLPELDDPMFRQEVRHYSMCSS